MDVMREADAFLRQPDPFRLRWRQTGKTRTRKFLLWSWTQREEYRLVHDALDGWWVKRRWVRV